MGMLSYLNMKKAILKSFYFQIQYTKKQQKKQ